MKDKNINKRYSYNLIDEIEKLAIRLTGLVVTLIICFEIICSHVPRH